MEYETVGFDFVYVLVKLIGLFSDLHFKAKVRIRETATKTCYSCFAYRNLNFFNKSRTLITSAKVRV